MNDVAFRALADARRRVVLARLLADGSLSVSSLAGVSSGSDSTARTVLRHKHLPMLADAGLITWDRANGNVERGPQFGELRPLLELFATEDGEWRGIDRGTAGGPDSESDIDSGTVD